MIADLITALVVAAVAVRLAAPVVTGPAMRIAVAVLGMVATLLPWPYGLAGWIQAHTGELSITTGLLALEALHHRIRGARLISDRELETGCVLIAGLALVFYPMSLGAGIVDPYALGYGNFAFSSVLLLLGLAAWVTRVWAPCVVLILAQFAFHFELLASHNLWDYLIDPLLAFWAIGWLVRHRLKQMRRRDAQAASGA